MSLPWGGLSALAGSWVPANKAPLEDLASNLALESPARPPCHESLTHSDLSLPENGANQVRGISDSEGTSLHEPAFLEDVLDFNKT